ncbi:MAG TPA: PEP-CTERM sorting domain-containing protein [Opitutales bacterium]|jgi:hypothetical protein|nr:PEP-CTERM sorting domain-containing protein [Opitutales bacterium]
MKIRSLTFAFILGLSAVSAHGQTDLVEGANSITPFQPGDLLVEQIGNGTAAVTSNGAPIFLDEFNPNGTLVQSFMLPDVGNGTSGNLAIIEGSAGSDALMTISSNGQYIAFSGYSANVGGSTSITSAASSSIPRVVGTLSVNGNLNIESLGSSAYGANNIRSAYSSNDGSQIWAAGANGTTGGIWVDNGGSPTQLGAGVGNGSVNAAGGQLFSSNKASIVAIGSGEPTTAGQTINSTLITPSGGNLGQFFFVDQNGSPTPNVLYVANNAANTSAILKYSLTSGNFITGTWTADGCISIGGLGNATNGTLDITGYEHPNGNVTIYGTASSGSAVFDFLDSTDMGTVSGTATSIITAPSNELFRSVVVVPEPAETAALLGGGMLAFACWRRRRKSQANLLNPSASAMPDDLKSDRA